MTSLLLAPLSAPGSLSGIGKRLAELLAEAETASAGDRLPLNLQDRIVNALEAIRARLVPKADRDPRSLFDLDEHLIELMDRVEESIAEGGDVPEQLQQEINDYLAAFRTKVDRIAGYWRWQESIAEICAREAERLEQRRKAALERVERLKSMLVAFMVARELKKLDGDKASIGVQRNGTPSLVIDDPAQIGERFFECNLRFTKAQIRDLISQLPEGKLRCRFEASITGSEWEISSSAIRSALANNSPIPGARLVRGHHVRLR